MDAQHPFILAPLDTLYRLSYDLDDAVRAAPGGAAAVAQQQVVDAICALLSLCSECRDLVSVTGSLWVPSFANEPVPALVPAREALTLPGLQKHPAYSCNARLIV